MIRIKISGQHATGKSFIAAVIKQALVQHGFSDVGIVNDDLHEKPLDAIPDKVKGRHIVITESCE